SEQAKEVGRAKPQQVNQTKPQRRQDQKPDKKGFQPLDDLFSRFALDDKGGYISQEFQDYGYRLAIELDDLAHKSLYIKMAKNTERGILDRALSFIKDASSAKSKARLFMWKVKQLKNEKKDNKNKETENKGE